MFWQTCTDALTGFTDPRVEIRLLQHPTCRDVVCDKVKNKSDEKRRIIKYTCYLISVDSNVHLCYVLCICVEAIVRMFVCFLTTNFVQLSETAQVVAEISVNLINQSKCAILIGHRFKLQSLLPLSISLYPDHWVQFTSPHLMT